MSSLFWGGARLSEESHCSDCRAAPQPSQTVPRSLSPPAHLGEPDSRLVEECRGPALAPDQRLFAPMTATSSEPDHCGDHQRQPHHRAKTPRPPPCGHCRSNTRHESGLLEAHPATAAWQRYVPFPIPHWAPGGLARVMARERVSEFAKPMQGPRSLTSTLLVPSHVVEAIVS